MTSPVSSPARQPADSRNSRDGRSGSWPAPSRAPPHRAVRPPPRAHLNDALALDLLHFEIGDRGLKFRVPVDQPLVAIDQPLAVELHEYLRDGFRQALVEREALARPIAGGAEPLQLAHNRPTRFRLPRPDAIEERLPAQRPPILALLGKLTLDHHLRGDAGVIGARLPQHVAALHAPIAAQHVLQRVVERVAHVQVAGDVGRRDHDAERFGAGAFRSPGAEGALALPKFADPALDRGEVERFVHHRPNQENMRLRRKVATTKPPATAGGGAQRRRKSAHNADGSTKVNAGASPN